MVKIMGLITFILLVLTVGCGFAIHYGGKEFHNAIKGHMVLGALTLITALILLISILKMKG